MNETQEINPYESTGHGAAIHHEPRADRRYRGQGVLETFVVTGAIAGVALFVMTAARGGPRSDLPTLHSASSYIITFRQAASGPGQFFGWLIAMVVICLPGVLLQGLVSLLEWSFGWKRPNSSAKLTIARRGVFWLSIAYATGWLICFLV